MRLCLVTSGSTFRDLTDDMPAIQAHWQKEGIRFSAIYTRIRTIASCGGICGINLVKSHLSRLLEGTKSQDPAVVFDAVCSHIEHFYNITPESTCLGLDFDGTEPLYGLESVDKIPTLFEALSNRGMDEKTAQNIFYNNAYNFFLKNL